jgi:methylphosphotriester-DNA--protein-cysteine methyltransferase
MIKHTEIEDNELHTLIRQKNICLAGNDKLKIYGRLDCTSGKRMKKQNRVFFVSVMEAREYGFRPCGHCLTTDYKNWKNGFIQ